MAEVKLDASEVMESLSIRLTMPKAFGPRMWVAGRLIWLARLISPVKIEAKVVDGDEA
jgi:hypothetical protein